MAELVLFVAVCVAYFNAFLGDYQFDDYNVIVRETSVASLAAWFDAQPGIRPLLKLSKADISGWLVTFALTVFADLTVAVEVGMILAALLFMIGAGFSYLFILHWTG